MRKNILKWILALIFPIVFNIVFFAAGGFEHPASVWISYVWIHLAYVLLAALPLYVRKTKSSHVFKFTTGNIVAIYFVIEFIIGLIFILARPEDVDAPLIVQGIPFILFLFVFIWDMLHNEYTADAEERRAGEISFIKSAASKAKIIMDSASDSDLKKRIEKVYDLIHSSPSRSNSSARELESNVMMMLSELADLVDEENVDEAKKIARKILFTMEERNRIVSLSNN